MTKFEKELCKSFTVSILCIIFFIIIIILIHRLVQYENVTKILDKKKLYIEKFTR